jgi:hypothetical protein
MFEQTFKNIDDVLWKEAGCATELDYTEQTSWLLFVKYLDLLENAELTCSRACRPVLNQYLPTETHCTRLAQAIFAAESHLCELTDERAEAAVEEATV